MEPETANSKLDSTAGQSPPPPASGPEPLAAGAGTGSGDLPSEDIEAALAAAEQAVNPEPQAAPRGEGVSVVRASDGPAAKVPAPGAPAAAATPRSDFSPSPSMAPPRASAAAAPPAGSVRLELPDFDKCHGPAAPPEGLDLLNDVELNVKIELGRAEMEIEEVLALGAGAIVELDKLAGDPVDVLINDRLVARGEVLVLNDNFCVRISEIINGAQLAEA